MTNDLQPGSDVFDPLRAYDLHGRVAIVTGAASGIGRASARMLAAVGATVACADLDGAGAAQTADSITSSGGTASAHVLDVSDRTAVHALVDEVIDLRQRLDIMANIAGIMISQPVAEITGSDFDRVMDVNLKGVFHCCQAAARVMTAEGRIVNMASAIVDAPGPTTASYAASKGGVVQLTRSFALELGPRGIRVNAIAPGWVVTGITERHFTDPDGSIDESRRAEVVDARAADSPLGVIGTVEDIAHAVLYLTSDAGRFCTGHVLRVNGGSRMA